MAVVDQYLSRRQLKNLQISLRTAFCVLPKENRIARCFLCTLRFKYENGCHVKGGGFYGRDDWWIDKHGLGRERENSCILLCTEIWVGDITFPTGFPESCSLKASVLVAYYGFRSVDLRFSRRCEFVLSVLLGSTEVELHNSLIWGSRSGVYQSPVCRWVRHVVALCGPFCECCKAWLDRVGGRLYFGRPST